ncbi:MAG: protein kinase [Deltaproteobacteria bacterium]|nr:protein kinase [Deltaproteobacteria bacterium]
MLPKVGTTIGEKYALEAVIGRGGMGAVYRAKNLLTGRRIALKWILPTLNGADEMRARLFREARAMGRIEHPNVCAVYDVGQDGDAVYLVMELLSGRPLRALMEDGRLEVREIAEILLGGMQGVSAAHAAGVVHRDLKPDNLFVCFDEDGRRGSTKVLDFGVSKILDLAESDGLTKSGMAVGTPHYMSPEQIIGSKDVDARSDVYGLGAILYQALAGRLPFEADNYSALVVQIATCSPEPLENHTTGEAAKLAPIVHRAIARKPSERFADVAEMALALEPFAGGARFETPRPRPRSLPPPPSDETSLAPASAPAPDAELGVSLTASLDRDLAPTRVPGGDRPPRSTPRLETKPTLPAHASGSQPGVEAPPSSGSTPASMPSMPSTPSSASLGPRASSTWWTIAGAAVLLVAIAIGLRMLGSGSGDTSASSTSHASAVPPPPSAPPAHVVPARHEVTSALTPRTSVIHLVTSTPAVTPPPAATTTIAPSEATEVTDTPPRERLDRLAPQAPQTRTRVRVASSPTPGEEPVHTTDPTPTTSTPTTMSSSSGEVMTATGRSGTISTSDFE